MEKALWNALDHVDHGDDVWIFEEHDPGWTPGVIDRRTGQSSYEVAIGGEIKRKHADQLRERLGATDDRPDRVIADATHSQHQELTYGDKGQNTT